MIKMNVISITIDETNEQWLKDLNKKLEEKCKIRIGISKILDVAITLLRENEEKSKKFELKILTTKEIEEKLKAFKNYQEKVMKIEEALRV